VNSGEVIVELENPRPVYHPGEVLGARYRLVAEEPCDVRAIELSVLWHTEGKGDSDLGVHFFEKIELPEVERRDCDKPRRLSTNLPRSPLSYDGFLLKIIWSVRVRMLRDRGMDLAGEVPFQFGELRQAQEVEES